VPWSTIETINAITAIVQTMSTPSSSSITTRRSKSQCRLSRASILNRISTERPRSLRRFFSGTHAVCVKRLLFRLHSALLHPLSASPNSLNCYCTTRTLSLSRNYAITLQRKEQRSSDPSRSMSKSSSSGVRVSRKFFFPHLISQR